MNDAFWGASNLTMNSPAGTPNMGMVTNMSGMFATATSFDGDISGWNNVAVTDMSAMFANAFSFNRDIGGWNTAQVTDMAYMFSGATAFDQNIGGWNTVRVGDMESMFNGATSFDQDIGNWDTAKVTSMYGMFEEATAFNQDIGNWNTAKVTIMERMFFNATSFNQDISGWNIAQVVNMNDMFEGATSFNQNLGRWYIGDGELTMSSTLMAGAVVATITTQNATLDAHNPVYTLSGTDANFFTLTERVLTVNQAPATTGKTSYTITIASTGEFGINNRREVTITFNEAGSVANFITAWRTTTANESITIPTEGRGYNYMVHWGDGSSESGRSGNATHTYTSAGDYTVSIGGVFPRIYFNNEGDVAKIREVTQWGNTAWTSMENAFWGANNLTVTATDAPDLSEVTSMAVMFAGASSFNGDIGGWNVEAVTTMSYMFWDASSFNQDISGWNTAQVTTMWNMFDGATSFDQDIGGWNVEAVTNMYAMFEGATAYNGDIGRWNIEAVTDMRNMFSGVTLSLANYDSLLVGWNRQNLQTGIFFDGGDSQYSSDVAHTARGNMISSDGWTITDGGRVIVPPNVHAPVFTNGATATVAYYVGNTTTTVTTVVATDADAGQAVTFTLTGGADEGLFTLTPAGELTFNTAPDYEVPTDTGTDNVYEVTITATDNGTPEMTATQALTITVTDEDETVTTGLEVFTDISVYPNPTGAVLHISGVERNARYTLSGIDGKVLKRGKLKAGKGDHSVAIPSLNKGIYVLQLITGKGSVTRKIVKE